MIVLRSGAGPAGRWVGESRNVLEDLRQALGVQEARLTMVALATDSDNTGEETLAGYADLHVVSVDRPLRLRALARAHAAVDQLSVEVITCDRTVRRGPPLAA